VPCTAFAGKKAHRVTARLIVRRVRRLAPPAQGELLPAWRHHAIFTDSPLPMLAAETDHRDHAITEQLIADLIDGPLAHLPSGHFAANAAWLTCAGIAHNLLRAAATLANPPPRPSLQLHPAPPPDQHRPARAPRTPPGDPAHGPGLAQARRLRRRLRRRPPRATSTGGLTRAPAPSAPTAPRPTPHHRPRPSRTRRRTRQRRTIHAPNNDTINNPRKRSTDISRGSRLRQVIGEQDAKRKRR
jgi:hypothetical protein